MKTRKNTVCLSACLIFMALLGIHVQPGQAEKLEAYSADQVRIRDGKTEKMGSLYIAPQRMRVEMGGLPGLTKLIMIVRQDEMVSYSLFPNQKKYIKQLLDEKDLKEKMAQFVKGITGKEEDIGKETVNGYACTKKKMETTLNILGRTMTTKATVWISEQIDFPLRTKNENGEVTELRNIRPGKPPDSLFEIPDGYEEASSMMEIMAEAMAGRKNKPETKGQQPSPAEMPEKLKEMLYGPNHQK